jgi:hypothetical protein
MTRRFLAAIILSVLAAAPVSLLAQASIGIAAGASAPISRLSDIADLGYNVSAGVNIGLPLLPVGVRLEGGFNSVGLKATNDNVHIFTATVNGVLSLGLSRQAPYLIAGLGAYNRSFTPNSLYGDSRTVFGLNGGGGLRFPLPGITTYFEARYHVMLGNTLDQTNYQFIPITFGVVF